MTAPKELPAPSDTLKAHLPAIEPGVVGLVSGLPTVL